MLQPKKQSPKGEGWRNPWYDSKTGRYVCQATIGYKRNKRGKIVPDKRTRSGKTPDEAIESFIAYMKVLGVNLDSLKGANSKRPTPASDNPSHFSSYLDGWIADRGQKNTISPKTAYYQQGIVDRHVKPILGEIELTDLDIPTLRRLDRGLVEKLKDTGKDGGIRTRQEAHKLVKACLRQAVREQLIPHNPMDAIDSPRTPRRVGEGPKAWSLAQARQFLEANEGDPYHSLVLTALFTGMRQGELFALTWGQVDLERRRIRVDRSLSDVNGAQIVQTPKTRKGNRWVPVPKLVTDTLRAHRETQSEGTHLVFPAIKGGYLRASNFHRRSWQPMMRRAREKYPTLPRLTFHQLRHTYATISILELKEPVKVVSERLGHANIEITLNTYSHVLDQIGNGGVDKWDKALGASDE